MSKPPPHPAGAAAKSQVEAFGQAFDAAMSSVDNVVIDGDGVPTRVEPSDSEQVYANDLEMRGVYTGPYNAVSDAPPSVGHLQTPKLQTLETAAVPTAQALASASSDQSPPAASFSSLIKVFVVLTLIGVGVVFALKSGVI